VWFLGYCSTELQCTLLHKLQVSKCSQCWKALYVVIAERALDVARHNIMSTDMPTSHTVIVVPSGWYSCWLSSAASLLCIISPVSDRWAVPLSQSMESSSTVGAVRGSCPAATCSARSLSLCLAASALFLMANNATNRHRNYNAFTRCMQSHRAAMSDFFVMKRIFGALLSEYTKVGESHRILLIRGVFSFNRTYHRHCLVFSCAPLFPKAVSQPSQPPHHRCSTPPHTLDL